ncbi:MAG: PEP-CTERM sorting domain-containing protein [Cyanobacteria bacterium J06642_11]
MSIRQNRSTQSAMQTYGEHSSVKGNIVGTGTLSFDGPASLGEFTLDSLANLDFSATIGEDTFSVADITSNLSLVSLLIFEEAGKTLATFTGFGAGPSGGSLDLSETFTHEPGFAEGAVTDSSDSTRKYYYADSLSGNFKMVLDTSDESESVPEPASLIGLAVVGVVAAGGTRKKKSA